MIKPAGDIFPGGKGDAVARAEPPQHAVNRTRLTWGDRRMTMRRDQKAKIRQRGDADRCGARCVAAHHRATHVGAISEVKRHGADPSAGGRVAAHAVVTTASTI